MGPEYQMTYLCHCIDNVLSLCVKFQSTFKLDLQPSLMLFHAVVSSHVLHAEVVEDLIGKTGKIEILPLTLCQPHCQWGFFRLPIGFFRSAPAVQLMQVQENKGDIGRLMGYPFCAVISPSTFNTKLRKSLNILEDPPPKG